MIIYNVTVKVDNSIAGEWLGWMLNHHIPGVLSTKCFHDYKMVQVIDIDDSEGPTYAIQYFAESMEDYKKYIEQFAPHYRKETTDKWGEKFIAFRSLLKVIA